MKAETKTPELLARFPMGRIPAVELADGRLLAESNAIIRYLARGSALLPEDGFAHAFAQNATDDQIALAKAVQRPIAVKCIQEPAPTPAWKSRPSWFLIAEKDRMIHPKTQRFMAERMNATIHSHKVDHTPLLTAPEKVVNIILEAAKATL